MTATLTSGSLFSGFLGLDEAVREVTGARTVWVSDIDPGACKILAHRAPDAPNLGDVSTVDWSTVPRVDILCGGFPCNDVSHAGKQEGLIHGTRSGLWHEFVRAIDALRPKLVVIENVRGLLSARGDTSEEYERADDKVRLATQLHEWTDLRRQRATNEGRTHDAQALTTRTHRILAIRRRAMADRKRAERRIVRAIGTVLGTLADLGYDARWHGLRAADVGAPHGRFRVFIVAYPRGEHSLERWVAAPRETEGGRAFGELAGRGRTPGTGDELLPTPDANPNKYRVNGTSQAATSLEAQARRGEIDGGDLLGTPRAAAGMRSPMRDPDAIDGQGRGRLEDQIALLGTPQARDGKGEGPTVSRWEERAEKRHLEAQLLLLPTPRAGDGEKGGPNQAGSSGDLMLPSAAVRLLPTPVATDAAAAGNRPTDKASHAGTSLTDAIVRNGEVGLLPTPRATRGGSGTETMYAAGGERTDDERPQGTLTLSGEARWGKYAPAIARWETLTRPAPPPTELSPRGTPRLNSRFSEWMMGCPDGWITDVPGITRNEALKACGNGVVRQQAAHALRLLLSQQIGHHR